MLGQTVDTADRPLVTVDVVIFALRDRDLQVLLIRRGNWPHEGMWAIPGGAVDLEETLEEAALRRLEEETGLTEVYLEQKPVGRCLVHLVMFNLRSNVGLIAA